jgi:5-formyltetrahydrofolate cyclo-ligase
MTPEPANALAAPIGAALRDAKRLARERAFAARNALTPEQHAEASRAITQRIAALPEFGAARVVLLTLPFRSEWDARLLVRVALAAGKSVVLPRVDVANRMLALHPVADLDASVVKGYRDIPEPRADTPALAPEAIDWVLVPGAAFDLQGGRLGYGGGFYDRLLPLFAGRVPRVAGAFEAQLMDQVPAAPHDLKVDLIATELRTVRASGGSTQ